MSRVGKKPIKIASGVTVSYNPPFVEVKGKGGSLKRKLPPSISVEIRDGQALVLNRSGADRDRALHGLSRSLISNMVEGVSGGYVRELELQGVGYRAQAQGAKLVLQVGFSHPVDFPLPSGIQATVEGSTKIALKGADKELLGLTASKLRKVRPPEPYKGKGIRFAGEVVTLKQGKTAGAGGK